LKERLNTESSVAAGKPQMLSPPALRKAATLRDMASIELNKRDLMGYKEGRGKG